MAEGPGSTRITQLFATKSLYSQGSQHLIHNETDMPRTAPDHKNNVRV